MPENKENTLGNTQAVVKKPRKFSLVWVIPCLACVITAILIWNNTINVGPEIKIIMSDAEGMEAGKTLVKFRSVVVGTVKDISLSDDFSKTVLTVEMKPNTSALLNKKSQFWVVKPRIENTTVTGLDTILSGAYIQMSKGNDQTFENSFVCLDTPPVNTEVGVGKQIYLESKESKKVQVGDPVIYKGFKVGSITYAMLDVKNDLIRYSAYIEEKYKNLIGKNTVFWSYSGVDFSLGASGIDLSFDNLNNILQGGVVFDNFSNYESKSEENSQGLIYQLFKNEKQARLQTLMYMPNFVVMVNDNLRNIAESSKVTYKGIEVGEVVSAPWYANDFDLYNKSDTIPVLIAINSKGMDYDFVNDFYVKALKEKRLCATVESSSLISGGNEIALLFDDGMCSFKYALYRNKPVIPIISGLSISDQIDSILANINSIDFGQLSFEMSSTLRSLSKLANNLNKISASLNDQKVVKNLGNVLSNLNNTLKTLNQTTNDYGSKSKVYKNLDKSLEQLNSIMKDLRPAVEKIGRNPNVLIFGEKNSDPEIKVGK